MKIVIYIFLIVSFSYVKAQDNQEVSAESKDEQPQISQRCLGGGLGARGIGRPVRFSRMPAFKQSSFSGGGIPAVNCGSNCGVNCGNNCGSNCGGNIGIPAPTFGYSGGVYTQPIQQQPVGYFGGSHGYNQGMGYHMAGHSGFAQVPMYG